MKSATPLLLGMALCSCLLPASATAAPAITSVLNNYSYTQPGYPNSGVSPSTLIVIIGTGMANPTANPVTLQSSVSPGLPTTLNGATVSVSAGAVTVTLGLYYALPTAIAGVLPAKTPTGTASVTVTLNGGAPSPAFQFQVVPAAPGLDNYWGTGGGLVTATNNFTGALIDFTHSATPMDTIVLWGSGSRADAADSDAGSSGYPGLTQTDVTIPANVPLGCRVSIVTVVGVDSNFALIPINPGGGVCSDSIYGYNGTRLSASLTSTVTSGIASIEQGENGLAAVTFVSDVDGNGYTALGPLSLGGCTVTQGLGPTQYGGTPTYLNAGTVTRGPLRFDHRGRRRRSTAGRGNPREWRDFRLFTDTGSPQVGPFTVTINLSPLMTWTNSSNASTVNRAQGLTINWSAGQPSSYIQIIGFLYSDHRAVGDLDAGHCRHIPVFCAAERDDFHGSIVRVERYARGLRNRGCRKFYSQRPLRGDRCGVSILEGRQHRVGQEHVPVESLPPGRRIY